ncbi:MAG: hypothetical protein R2762_27875 [Bryobacteraceae bacterium]
MRCCAYLKLGLILCASAVGASERTTVFFDFRGAVSTPVYEEMKRELTRLFDGGSRRFAWKRLEEASELGPLPDLAVLRLTGDCRMPPAWPAMDERGPLAWTHISEGSILTFGGVNCERLRAAVATALWGGDRGRADIMLGRALGRVAAHELVHMFARTKTHSAQGLARTGLTAAELVSDNGGFSPEDLHRLDADQQK